MEVAGSPVLVSIPIDPNTAELHELMAIPGVGEGLAARILEDRLGRGPFRSFDDLRRVPGLRRDTLDGLEPFVKPSEVGPVNLNTAASGELETLPGIGPVLAAKIIVDRAENGPYETLGDLERVHGVGPALIESLSGLVEVAP